MIDEIGTFLGLVGGVLTLDLGASRGIQAAPNGLGVAAAIVLLACASDALGNSPLLFIRRLSPPRVAISLAVATLLAAVRLAVWPIARRSRWNRAIAAGRLSGTCLGEMGHTGPGGYLDPDAFAPDGRSYLEVTASTMLAIVDQRPGGAPHHCPVPR